MGGRLCRRQIIHHGLQQALITITNLRVYLTTDLPIDKQTVTTPSTSSPISCSPLLSRNSYPPSHYKM